MKFQCTVDISLPIDQEIGLFEDPDNLKHWQDGFVSYEHLSGNPKEPGAKAKLVYHTGNRKMELIETLITMTCLRSLLLNTGTNR